MRTFEEKMSDINKDQLLDRILHSGGCSITSTRRINNAKGILNKSPRCRTARPDV